MGKKSLIPLMLVFAVLALSSVSAGPLNITLEREFRLTFGHIVYLSGMKITPEMLSPGDTGEISFVIENTGTQFIRDIITEINLPSSVYPYNDITVNKIPEMMPGEKEEIKFSFIVSPTAEEGIYRIPVEINYVNHVGDERTENETLSMIVLGKSKILAEIKSSEIYQGNEIGNVKIKLINNNLGNIKFLLVQLNEGEGFEIINGYTDYIGDLDSDDFSEVSFRIKATSPDNIVLPLTLTYKDSMNRDYTQEVELPLKIQTAEELGVKKSNSWIIISAIVVLAVIFFAYRSYRKKKLLREKHASFKTKFNF